MSFKLLLNKYINYHLYIFDVDGTLVNSNDFHKEAWISCFKYFDVQYNENFYESIMGVPSIDVARKYSINQEKAYEICTFKQKKYKELLNNVSFYPNVLDVLFRLKQLNKLVALCTGGSKATVQSIIKRDNLESIVDFYVCGDDSINPKPHPEPYLQILKHFNINAKDSIAIEDSNNGIKSALAAKLNVLVAKNGNIIDYIGTK